MVWPRITPKEDYGLKMFKYIYSIVKFQIYEKL